MWQKNKCHYCTCSDEVPWEKQYSIYGNKITDKFEEFQARFLDTQRQSEYLHIVTSPYTVSVLQHSQKFQIGLTFSVAVTCKINVVMHMRQSCLQK